MRSTSKHVVTHPDMNGYRIGDRDERPWGHYVVTGAGLTDSGEEYCEKIITIQPGKILSLQSHALRREIWIVRKGTMTALRDGMRLEVAPRESIYIPQGSIHCMANLEEEDCIVEERQEGVCREDDILRYMDAYQRTTEALPSREATESFNAYRAILSDIKKIAANKAQGVPY